MFLRIMNFINKLLFLYKIPLNSEIMKIYIIYIILFKNINQKKLFENIAYINLISKLLK